MRNTIGLVLVGSMASIAMAAPPPLEFMVDVYSVNDFQRDENGAPIYNGISTAAGRMSPGRGNAPIAPGDSILLRVSIAIPGHNEPFTGPGGETLFTRGLFATWFDINVLDPGSGGTSTGAAAPLHNSLYDLGVTTTWGSMIGMFHPGSPGEAHFNVDAAGSASNITPAQLPPYFTNPANTEAAPWVFDFIWTPYDYTSREVTFDFVTRLDDPDSIGILGSPSVDDLPPWLTYAADLPGTSVTVPIGIVPAPAGASALLTGCLLALRRRR